MLLFTVVFLSNDQEYQDLRYERIREALNYFVRTYPQQKVYLHTDKDHYNGGDDIWIKAYLLNGINHNPDSLSINLYVELFGPDKNRVEIKRFMMHDGFGSGTIHLSDTLPEGLYQLRAFTNWMQNFDVDYFFTKNFQLKNPDYTAIISPGQARDNIKELDRKSRLDADFDIQFLPEGGSLVYGLESVVAFKAVNKLGRGIDVTGDLFDGKNNMILSFSSFHNGMGTFIFKPEKNFKYYAVVSYNDETLKVQMPKPEDQGIVMRVEDGREEIRVTLTTNRMRSGDRNANEVIVTGQVRGEIYFHTIQNLETGTSDLRIDKSVFPTGIAQLTVFSVRGEPLAERLVFVNHNDHMNISIEASDIYTDEGIKTQLAIRVTDKNNKPLQSNLSLSVTRNLMEQVPANDRNIISYMLLSSDLKGYIEDPSYYFSDFSASTLKALDNLMLTHGWRRFEWSEIVAGVYPEIRYFEELGIVIEGRIVHDFFDIPLKDSKVQLTIMDQFNDVFTQFSGERGYFRFDNLFYFDTVSMKIEAWRKSGRRNLLIQLADEEIKDIGDFYGDYYLTTVSERDNQTYRREKAERDRLAYLEELEREKNADNNRLEGIHGEPDDVLKGENIPDGMVNILEAMSGRIAGVNVQGDRVTIRGPNSFYLDTQPLFLVDNMPVTDVDAVKSIPVESIDRIEVIKGPGAAIYGVRGANGVIAIYTKRGQFMRRGVIEFDVLGYSRPRTFYQPRYEPREEPSDNYSIIWQPEIETNSSGRVYIVFDKPVIEGAYRFVLEGISYQGHVGYFNTVIDNQN